MYLYIIILKLFCHNESTLSSKNLLKPDGASCSNASSSGATGPPGTSGRTLRTMVNSTFGLRVLLFASKVEGLYFWHCDTLQFHTVNPERQDNLTPGASLNTSYLCIFHRWSIEATVAAMVFHEPQDGTWYCFTISYALNAVWVDGGLSTVGGTGAQFQMVQFSADDFSSVVLVLLHVARVGLARRACKGVAAAEELD